MTIFKLAVLLIFVSVAFGKVLFENSKVAKSYYDYHQHPHRKPILEIEFLGSCKEFRHMGPISVNKFSNGDCLPISLAPGNIDEDSLQSYVSCKNKGHGRSLISFNEVYGNDPTDFIRDIVVSFKPSRPFRAKNYKGPANYFRRPRCEVTANYCDHRELAVSHCGDVPVQTQDGYVITKDIIYIVPNKMNFNSCEQTSCCIYIGTHENAGICPNQPSGDLLPFTSGYKEHPVPQQQQQQPPQPQQQPITSQTQYQKNIENDEEQDD